jgi:hypothetical protein
MNPQPRDSLASKQEIYGCLLLVLLGAIVLRGYMVSCDMNLLLDQGLVQDDAFYYFVIARNILTYGVSSFDTLHPTNGFHPLWETLCLPVFNSWHGDLPVRIMLALAAGFDVLSIALVFLILRKITQHPYTALCGAAILALHGTLIRTWFNGLETALSVLSLLWFFHQFLRLYHRENTTVQQHLYLGVLAAFAFLARTDNAVVVLVLFSFLYLPKLFRQGEFRMGLLASMTFLLLSSPWLLWNQINFGSIVQVSGQIRDNTWLEGGAPVELPIAQQLVYGFVVSLEKIKIVFGKMFSPDFFPDTGGYLYLAALLTGCAITFRKSTLFRQFLSRCLPFIAGVIVLFLYHAGVRHFVRGWYNAPVLLVLTLLLCGLFDALFARHPAQQFARIILLLLCSTLLLLYSPFTYLKSPEAGQTDPRISTANWLNQHTPVDALIGAANAGIMGYYAERRVVNLDGVVNESAFRARIANQLPHYIDLTGIRYLADHKGSIAHLCNKNPFYTCSKVWSSGGTWVMEIRRTGSVKNQR